MTSPTSKIKTPRPVRSVLVLTKHRFMGDTIVAVPLLRAVRRLHPDARITLVTGEQAATVLQNCPYTDQIFAHSQKAAARTPAGSVRLSALLVRQMAELFWRNRPDLCLVADRSFRAAVAAVLAGGRIRAGFDSEGRGCLLTHPVAYDLERPEAECCLDILRAVSPELPGEPCYNPRPELWVTAAERMRGEEILRLSGSETGGHGMTAPLVGIQPGASHDYKEWPSERFAEVARQLAGEFGATIVLMGKGDMEQEAAQRMQKSLSAGVPVFDLTNKTSLRETMGVLTHLSLFIGNDTGVNHIAAALGTPTVALFGPTPAHKWGNRGPRNRVLTAPDDTLDRLPVSPVLETARALLEGPPLAVPAPAEGDLAVGASR